MTVSRAKLFSRGLRTILIIFFSVTVLLPLISMLSQIQWSQIGRIVSTGQFGEMVLNSLGVTTCATVISVALAYLLAFAVNRSRIPCKGAITVLATLPMLIPSISHGIGLINLFGDNGIITRMLGVESHLLGFNGILLGSVLYSFPVAFLMLSDAMKYADATPYEAAQVLGIPKANRFFAVTMQYMKRPLISATFAVFTMVFTDYGVPLAVGGRFTTLPKYLYTEIIGLQNFSSGAFIGLILLIPALVTFLLDLSKKDNEAMGFNTKKMVVTRNRGRDVLVGIGCAAIIGFVLLVLSSFAIMTFMKSYPYDLSFTLDHIRYVMNQGMGQYFANSLLIAFLVSVIGTVIGYTTAYVTARTQSPVVGKALHLVSIASLAIPGIVLGLGYLICFRGSFLSGTILILVFVNIIHFFASPYMMAYNALKKLNPNYEDVGKTLCVGRMRLLRDVFVPNTLSTIGEMFAYFFVNSMITISAVSFLYKTTTMPLALMINQLEGNMKLEAAAFVSLVILLTNILLKLLVSGIRRLVKKKIG